MEILSIALVVIVVILTLHPPTITIHHTTKDLTPQPKPTPILTKEELAKDVKKEAEVSFATALAETMEALGGNDVR